MFQCEECYEKVPNVQKWKREGRTLCPYCYVREVEDKGSWAEKEKMERDFG